MITKRDKCEKASKVGGRFGHGDDIQTDIASGIAETANPASIGDCPIGFGARVRRQARDDVGVVSRLRAEIDEGESLGRAESPRASSARER